MREQTLRILEISMICIDVIIILWLLWFQPRHKKNVIFLRIGIVLLFSILLSHLLIEGYRLTMVPLYVVSGIVIVLIGLKLIKNNKVTTIHRLWRYTGYISMLLLVAIGSFLSMLFPVFQLPKPTGNFDIGTQTLHFIDSSRSETFTDDTEDHRELMVQLWYPTETSQANKDSLFMMNTQSFRDLMDQYGQSLGTSGLALQYWKYIGANSYQEAPVKQGGPYPVVLVSHGLGNSKMLHTSQAENLASHGYIVIGIDHTYSSIATLFPNGKVTPFKTEFSDDNFQEEAMKLETVWLADIKYILEQLQLINNGDIKEAAQFQHHLDLSAIGMMGFSFGGATAYDAVKEYPELTSGINMDGTLINVGEEALENKPFLFLMSDFVAEIGNQLSTNPSIPENTLQLLKKEQEMINHTLQHGGYAFHLKGADHYNFTDLQLYSNALSYIGMTGKIKSRQSAEIVNALIVQFFDQTLKKDEAKSLSDLMKMYPEIKSYKPNS